MVVRGGGGGKGAEVVVVLVRGGGVGGCVTALRPKLLYAHRALAPMRVSMACEANAKPLLMYWFLSSFDCVFDCGSRTLECNQFGGERIVIR